MDIGQPTKSLPALDESTREIQQPVDGAESFSTGENASHFLQCG